MLLPPLCLLGLSLVSPGNFTDLGCRIRLLRKDLRKESHKRGCQRLCSDYYDQDGETRRLNDRRRERLEGLANWRGREKHFLEDG
ncbi:hypothetical protein DY000_02009505 [Brassica cretica]|uniref:Uncharacterized protein n=1 Tax=Brassica cretica TaxID=69181 RepID=A0ABQ7C4W5_BRACR|nr:hypothetical protein DY000_02009505 [Brassica cretica]